MKYGHAQHVSPFDLEFEVRIGPIEGVVNVGSVRDGLQGFTVGIVVVVVNQEDIVDLG